MANHFAQQRVWNAAIEHNCIPMPLVHVVARPDGGILFAECSCPVRIALEVDPWRNTIEGNQSEHSPFDCEDEHSRAEGETLACAWEASTERTELVYMHSSKSSKKRSLPHAGDSARGS